MKSELGKPIAIGGSAEIYDWEPGWILKLYFDRFGPGMADYERCIAISICATGLPIPVVGEIVDIDGRKGLLYEKCAGEQMGENLARHPWRLVSYALALANLHAEMHTKPMRADVARTSILARGMVEIEPQFSRFQRFGLRIMHAVYLRRYFQLCPGGQDEFRRWLPIVAAGRLNENVPGWDSWLLEQAGKLL